MEGLHAVRSGPQENAPRRGPTRTPSPCGAFSYERGTPVQRMEGLHATPSASPTFRSSRGAPPSRDLPGSKRLAGTVGQGGGGERFVIRFQGQERIG